MLLVPDPERADGQPALSGTSADNGVAVMVIGTTAWLVVAVASLLGRDWLAEQGYSWWLRTAWIGVVLGIIGVVFTRRRARAYRAHHLAEAHVVGEDP